MIGGGAIGLEMAQFYRRMGSRVTVIEFGAQIAGHEDPDIAQALQAILESEGIEFRLRTPVKRIGSDSKGLKLALGEDGSSQLEASQPGLNDIKKATLSNQRKVTVSPATADDV